MAQVLRYPDNVAKFNKWLRFDVMRGRHVGRDQVVLEKNATDSVVMAAALYLPSSALRSSMTVGYDTTEFSGMMMEAAAQAANELGNMKLGQDTASTAWDATSSLLGAMVGLVKGASAETVGEFAKSQAMNEIGTRLGAEFVPQVEALVGQKANPRTDIIFTAQDYRTWTFEYIFIPRTLAEAQAIEQIVNMFRFYMLPVYKGTTAGQGAKGAYMMGYPYEWNITAYGADLFGESGTPMGHVNKFGRSVLRNLTVDQAGGGKVAFVAAGGTKELYPLVTNMTLEFQEVILLGRDMPDLVGGRPAGGDPRNE